MTAQNSKTRIVRCPFLELQQNMLVKKRFLFIIRNWNLLVDKCKTFKRCDFHYSVLKHVFSVLFCLNKIFRKVKCPHQSKSNINKRSDTKKGSFLKELKKKNKEVAKGGHLKWQLFVCLFFFNVRTMFPTGKHYFYTECGVLFFLWLWFNCMHYWYWIEQIS